MMFEHFGTLEYSISQIQILSYWNTQFNSIYHLNRTASRIVLLRSVVALIKALRLSCRVLS